MVSKGLCRPGDVVFGLPPLSRIGRQAIEVWNRLGGDVSWPGTLFELVQVVDEPDYELVLDLLSALRELGRK